MDRPLDAQHLADENSTKNDGFGIDFKAVYTILLKGYLRKHSISDPADVQHQEASHE
jgi:hypothetical protein